jgi:hypothetical protein
MWEGKLIEKSFEVLNDGLFELKLFVNNVQRFFDIFKIQVRDLFKLLRIIFEKAVSQNFMGVAELDALHNFYVVLQFLACKHFFAIVVNFIGGFVDFLKYS